VSTRKRLVLILIAFVVIGFLWWSFRPEPIPVSVAEVHRGPLQVTVQQEGRTRVHDRYVVAAPVTGYAERLVFEVGDAVRQGQVLMRVNPSLSQPLDPRSRAQAEAQVAEAEAAHELALADLERIRSLFRRGDVSQSAFDQARTAVDRARANLAAARALLAKAPSGRTPAAEYVPVTAPVAGRILAIDRKSEGPVTVGTPLLAIGDPDTLEVAVDVLSSDAVRLREGMRVRLDRWGGGEPLEGRVRRVEPAGFTKISALGVEEQRVWTLVDITSPREQWRNLGDAYRVEASFILWESNDALQVPASAVFREGERWAVFVVEDRFARKRRVEVGRHGGLDVQILDGLVVGERVVTHPDDALADGAAVVLREAG
jgi:HlyD family secretion protein